MNAEILQFLRELRANNNREWFKQHKDRHDALRQSFIDTVQEVINRIATFDPDVAGQEAKDCMFRIYRDVRFSPNKQPYKTHFSAYMAKGGRKSEYSGYYLHIEPDNCVVSGGIWMPEPKLLKLLRKEIYDQIEEFTEILENPAFKKSYPTGLVGDTLSRMPAGFPADSSHGDIMKHKDFVVVSSKPDDFFLKDNWMDEVITDFKQLQSLNQFLNYTVDEYLGRV